MAKFYPTTRRLSYVNSELQVCKYDFDQQRKGGECSVVLVSKRSININCLEFSSAKILVGAFISVLVAATIDEHSTNLLRD